MNQNTPREPDEISGPLDVLGERSLAVDLALAEIDQQIATAHKYPRSLDVVIKKIETMACYNEAAALNSIYSLPRAGKAIIGPSIGFANIVANSWGNCVDAARIVHVDRKEKMVVCEGAFHDLESNRRTIIPEQRRIVDSKGRIYSDDMIITTSKAGASIARRNAILHAVPRPLWFPIFEQALAIVRGSVETFGERKDKALKSFSQFGIKPDQIIAFLGLKGEADLTLEHIPTLRGAYAALRDGALTPEEVLDPRRQAAGSFEKVENPLGDETHDAKTGEVQTMRGSSAEAAKADTIVDAAGTVIKSRDGEQRGPGPRHDGQDDGGEPGGDEAPAGDQQPTGSPPTNSDGAALQADAPKPQEESQPAKAKRERKPAAKAKAAETTPAQEPKPADAPKAADGAGLTTPEQYCAYAKAWIAESTSVAGLNDRWSGERELRTKCRVTEDFFEDVKGAKDKRAAELKAAG